MMTSTGSTSASKFQLVNIEGDAYFLDNRSGIIYKIIKNADGTFDINESVGQVMLKHAD